MKKAVITDLDGTLLDKYHELSDFTKDTLNKFLQKGYKLYVATGRIEKGAKLVTSKLDKKISLITTNGTRIIDENDNEIMSIKLDKESADFLLNYDYEQHGENIFINAYPDNDWLVCNDKYYTYYSSKRKDKIFRPRIVPIDEIKSYEHNKIYYIGEYEQLKKIRKDLEENLDLNKVNIDFVSETSLEIYSKKSNKALAAKMLLERDNISVDEVIAFGDGQNDIEMLKLFKDSYVMSNALDVVKNELKDKEQIGYNYEDAVAKKIIEVFNL